MARIAFACGLSLLFLSFGQLDAQQVTRWYVYMDADSRENHGHWTNLMPAEAAKMVTLNMVDGGNPASGATSIRGEFNFVAPWWAGVAVASVPDYWGETVGGQGYDIRGATKLVFQARGLRGGESIQVKVGVAGDKRFGDSTKIPPATPWLKLEKEWRRFELDLARQDLSRIITPFAVVADRAHNPDGGLTFFLDDIYFEMGPSAR